MTTMTPGQRAEMKEYESEISAAPKAEAQTLKPGILRDLDFDTYHAIDAVNHGILQGFTRTPAHVRYELDHGGKGRTPSLDLGWLTHVAVLEPERYEEQFVVPPKVDRRTKEGKATWARFEAANPGKQAIAPDEDEWARAMRNALFAHPTAGEFLRSQGVSEVSILWDEGGTPCKARIDRIGRIGEWPIIGDVKTARNASRREFERASYNYGYGLQAVHYLAGLEAVVPIPAGAPFRRFVFFVVESAPPHPVACYELDDTTLAQAEQDRQRFLRKWRECKKSGRWPGYPDGIELASYPAWAFKAWATEE
jgi:exodeoxyribonuclease VIII